MNIPVLDPHEVGAHGVDNLVTHAEQICAYEERRIELTNQGTIASLLEEHKHLTAEEDRLLVLLREAPPLGGRLRLLRRAIFCWALTIMLTGSGFALTIMTLEPFRLGPKAWIYGIGVSILTPFLIDEVLSNWPILVKLLTPIAAAAGLAGIMLFAVIRGSIFGEGLHQNQAAAVVIDDVDQAPAPPQNDFYASTTGLLSLAFLLIAFSTEVGAGIALREARRSRPNDAEDWDSLRRELRLVRSRDAVITREAIALRNEPAIFGACFRRDFYWAILTNAVRKSLANVLAFTIFAALISASRLPAQENLDEVIAIDLTASVNIAGPDDKSDFQKNIDGIVSVLKQLPAGARVTVIGITDHSFSQPYILMRARIGADPGYFGERLGAARRQLVRAWKLRSGRLEPRFRRTDILGAIELASQIFAQEKASHKELLIFSDMRQNTVELNLESPRGLRKYSAVANQYRPPPDLRGVEIVVLGASGAGDSIGYWANLKAFWVQYFGRSGAKLETYSILREQSTMR